MAIYKKLNTKKSTSYDDMVNLIKANGWTDISSKPATDYNVFYSAGTSGTKELYVQMVPFTYSAVYGMQNNVVYPAINVILRGNYTPGAAGVAGTFERAVGQGNCVLSLMRNGTPLDQPMIIWYDITADHISIVLEEDMPNFRGGHWLYIGLPSRSFIDETSKSGLIVAGTSFAGGDQVVVANYTPLNASYTTCPVYLPNVIATKTLKGKMSISEMAYGDTITGIRGAIDDIYYVKDKVLLEGDNAILPDGRVFRYLTGANASYVSGGSGYGMPVGSFPSASFCFRIA